MIWTERFFTNELNNESYNLALVENRLKPFHNRKRITKELVKSIYPEMSERKFDKIITQKQNYFINNIGQIQKNEFLFDLLRRLERGKCILWTSADKRRAESIFKEFELQRFFENDFLKKRTYTRRYKSYLF